jgi:hypothetical protein
VDGLKKVFILIIAITLTACGGPPGKNGDAKPPLGDSQGQSSVPSDNPVNEAYLIYPQGHTVKDRVMVPEGYERVAPQPDSFAQYLQNLPLKPHGSKVLYFDGREKGREVHRAVIDMDIGSRDLQQCADAVIRLRAEYLYNTRQYEKIHFNFTNGFNAQYIKWMQGNRILINGNNASWVAGAEPLDDYESFRKYLDMVFAYAGTLSLSKELESVDVSDIEIGDVFIRGGSPGHCVLVLDMALCSETGKKLVLLAQSYMPAQEIHILKNLRDKSICPWFRADFGDKLITPEWTFEKNQLMRFRD